MVIKMTIQKRAVLKAEARAGKGTGVARAIRKQGKVPVVLYGKGKEELFLSLNTKELNLEYLRGRFFSRVVEIELNGKKILANPKEIQFDRVKDIPIHADFMQVDEHTQIKISVPVEFLNVEKCPGIKRGGVLNVVRRTVDIFCNIDNIPDKLIADLDGLKIGDNIKYSGLKKPEGISPVITTRDFTIATIAGRGEDEAAAVVDPNAPATPAAPVVTGQKNAAAQAAAAPGIAAAAKASAAKDAKK